MGSLIIQSGWFQGVAGTLEIFSGFVALLIMLASWKAYKLTKEGKFRLFSMAFGFITLSFVARAMTALSVLIETAEDTFEPIKTQLNAMESVFSYGRFAYVTLILAAYLILTVLTLNTANLRIVALLSILTFILSIAVYKDNVLIGLVLLMLLMFISVHYFENYKKTRKRGAFISFLAFIFVMVETGLFMLASKIPELVIVSYGVRLVAYMLLLTVVMRVYTWNGTKKQIRSDS